MKKIVCVALALLMCLSMVAMAEEFVPSKNTADMVTVTIDREQNPNIPEDSGFVVFPVQDAQLEEYPEHVALCTEELTELMKAVAEDEGGTESSSVQAYFGEIKDSEGNVVVLSELLGAKLLDVFEFMPLIAINYDEVYGDVKLIFQFKTPYDKDEKVILLVGLPVPDPENEDAEVIEWTAFEGVGVGEEGAVEVVFTPEIITAIQNEKALLAVVSVREPAEEQPAEAAE